MSLFRIYVDGALFYHPQMSKLAITAARIEEDAENIDSMTLSAPYNHPYLSAIRPLASTIVCKRATQSYLKAERWTTVRIFITPIPGPANPALHI